MKSWSLCIDDVQLEVRFRDEQFSNSYRTVMISGAAVVVSFGIMASCYVSQRYLFASSALGMLLLGIRARLATWTDVSIARTRFSASWCFLCICGLGTWFMSSAQWLMCNADDQLEIGSLLALILAILKIMERLSCVTWPHSHATFLACIAQIFSASSKVRPIAAYLPVLGLVLGTLFGVVLEHARRISTLSTWVADDAEVEAREVETEARRLEDEARAQRVSALESEVRKKQLDALADGRLNHLIKGTCGTARTAIELSLERMVKTPGAGVPDEMCALLNSAVEALQQATEWVDQRQVFVSLEHGIYRSIRVQCNPMELLGSALRSFSCVVEVEEVSSIMVDSSVLAIVVSEALSNARKYRDPTKPIIVRASLRDVDDWPLGMKIEIENQNRPGAPYLTAQECVDAFRSGYRALNTCVSSHGIGLSSVQQAVDAAHGRVWLSATEHATTFTLLLPADRAAHGGDRSESGANSAAHAAGATEPYNSLVHADQTGSFSDLHGSDNDSRGNSFKHGSFHSAHSSSDAGVTDEPGLVCVGLDDDMFQRQCLTILFSEMLQADMSRSIVLGDTDEQMEAFVGVALGELDLQLQPVPLRQQMQVHVVVIDQNIYSHTGKSDVGPGTRYAAELRNKGYTGVICILTGSSEAEIERIIRSNTCVDLVFPKGTPLKKLAQGLLKCSCVPNGR